MSDNKDEKMRVLVVEDEAISAILYKKILTRLGYDVCTPVATGEDAIKTTETERPDIILMDINLIGNLDGIEAAREITSNYPTPIIFITGYSNEETRERAMELDPIAYLTKPINFDNLHGLIRTSLES